MSRKAFRKVLVANRGEIACRIFKTLERLSIRSVAIFEEPEKNARHVHLADEAWPIQSFLAIQEIIELAKKTEADAIHPGYGFLSENHDFALAVQNAGLAFIGPDPETIRIMGDKVEARIIAREAGVPLLPGGEIDKNNSPQDIEKIAGEVGFPLLLKAAAGGGGKAMSIVNAKENLVVEVERLRNEANRLYNNDKLVIEKYLEKARHIEVQIMGDSDGVNWVISDRECSVQRNNQKIIEEAPAAILDTETRKELHQGAIALANRVGYKNAGTLEYLYNEAERQFYFLEMNTRLQVEHTVTEMVTGVDLVEEQIKVAMKIPCTYEDIKVKGHAIECRVCAESADLNFLPDSGPILLYREPAGVRVDTGIEQGSEVLPVYDNMVAKLVLWSEDRDSCITRTLSALNEFVVMGVTTNIPMLRAICDSRAFRENALYTRMLRENQVEPPENGITLELAAALIYGLKKKRLASRNHNHEGFTLV